MTRGKEEKQRPRPCNKVVQATLEGKESAFQRLKEEVVKRDPDKKKQGVALVDGEHKLRQLMQKYLPWFLIIIDIYHVMEYLLKMRSIQINGMTGDYWQYHIAQEKRRLYGIFRGSEMMELAA